MININLKAKHYRLIAYLLKNIAAYQVFNILSTIKNSVSNEAKDTDEIISVDPKELTFVYPILSNMKEGEAAEINKEMDYMLRPQMEAGIISGNQEWGYVAQFIQNHKDSYKDQLQKYIDEGKEFLNGTK
jgi:hypothetical protein